MHDGLDYEDWAEALGTWLGAVQSQPEDLDFDGWAAIWSHLDERLPDCTDHARRSQNAAVAAFWRGEVTGAEVLDHIMFDTHDAVDQLWSGIGAHRAGASWMGHLLIAALAHGGRETIETNPFGSKRALLGHWLAVWLDQFLASPTLEGHWRVAEDGTPATEGVAMRLQQLRAFTPSSTHQDSDYGAGVGSHAWRFDRPIPIEHCRHVGEPVAGEDVAEAAWTAAASGDVLMVRTAWTRRDGIEITADDDGVRPPDEVITQAHPRLLLLPERVTPASVVGVDLVRGVRLELTRTFHSATGWEILRKVGEASSAR